MPLYESCVPDAPRHRKDVRQVAVARVEAAGRRVPEAEADGVHAMVAVYKQGVGRPAVEAEHRAEVFQLLEVREVGAVDVGAAEDGAVKVGAAEVGAAEVGAAEVGDG